MTKAVVWTDRAPSAIGPYSQAIKAGPFVFCSGQVGINPVTGELVAGGVENELRQVMSNLVEVLKSAGASWDGVVKTTIFLTNLADFGAVNRIYGEHVDSTPPARSTVQVSALPRGASVEIEVIAYVGASK